MIRISIKEIGIIFMVLSTFISGCISESPGPNNIIPVWTKIFDIAVSFGHANQTSDGGYIMIANLQLSTVDNSYQSALKTDKNGKELWNKTFGGSVNSIEQTSDGRYLLSGYTRLYGKGNEDAWLIRTDKNGNELWNKTFARTIRGGQFLYAKQTSDGGYIAVGETHCNWEEGSLNDGGWLIKTDSSGNEQWNKTFGGTGKPCADINRTDYARTIQQTSDGGYIIGGLSTLKLTGDILSYAWLIKTDINGNEQWNRTFRESNLDYVGINYVQQISDEGYIAVVSENIWMIKTDKKGNVQWNRTFGGSASSAQQTSDGGYIISGSTADISAKNRIIKTDSKGSTIWDKILEDPGQVDIDSIRQVPDGGYIIAGARTVSSGFGFGDNFRRRALLLKIINISE